ncbi:MAG: hypothetical protein KGQ51_15255, partial [Planctomycetes bacterium]|nr:hypothetical protein [Planctomycetota bacterium]
MLRYPPRTATEVRLVSQGWLSQSVVFLATFLGLILGPIASAQEAATPAALTNEQVEFFEKKIRPILVERCYEC